MDILDQLYEVYLTHWWIEEKLSKMEIDAYHRILISRGNLMFEGDNGILVGYQEVLKINIEQFGRIVLDIPFSATEENSLDGNIAVMNHIWIHPDYRNTWVIKSLQDRFMIFTDGCDKCAGLAFRKGSNMIKVFNRESLLSFMHKGESLCLRAS